MGRISAITDRKSGRGRSKPGRRSSSASVSSDSILIWGHHACEAAIRNPARRVQSIATDRKPPTWLNDALAETSQSGIDRPSPKTLDRTALAGLVPDQAVHQGVVMAIAPLPSPSLDGLIAKAHSQDTSLLIVLDQVVDPHNVGAILRSAAVFGALAVIVQSRHAPQINGTLFKIASGGAEYVPILPVTNIARALTALSEGGITTIGFAEEASQDLRDITPSAHSAIVMGGEGTGLRRLVSQSCDLIAKLSTPGPISTLNVSNATAVALHHIDGRQRFSNG